MQKQLDNLYLSYLERVFSDKELAEMIESYVVSSPQFLDVNTPRCKYKDCQYKLLLIGKETNGWFNSNERNDEGLTIIGRELEKYMTALKKIYRKHNIGVNYRTSIYLFIDLLIERMNDFKETWYSFNRITKT